MLTPQPALDPAIRESIPPFKEVAATVLSPAAAMPPLLARDETALFLTLQAIGAPHVMAGGMVLQDGLLVGIVTGSTNLGDVWAAPTAVLRGGEVGREMPLPAARATGRNEWEYNQTVRQGPLEVTLWRGYQSLSGFTVQLRLRNHSSQPLLLARTEDFAPARRDQHSPVRLVTGRDTSLAPISYGYSWSPKDAEEVARGQRTGFPPEWILEPNAEIVADFGFSTSVGGGARVVFKWTGIEAPGDGGRIDFEFKLVH